jgi:hypothetical protein
MTKHRLLWVSALANLILLLAVYFVFEWPDSELANYREWSILQAAESSGDRTEDRQLILLPNFKDSGYGVFGVPVESSEKTVWLLGNSKHSPKIKMLPVQQRLRLTSDEIRRIEEGIRLNDDMKTFLKAIMNDS